MVPLAIASLAGGCAIDPCGWAEPIRPSRADALTDGTAAQIVAHNLAGERICGWRPGP